tara:strand:+ start:420 stop:548 length:129 start_codon:yes stop_codon:yes gene_type:complete
LEWLKNAILHLFNVRGLDRVIERASRGRKRADRGSFEEGVLK